LLALLIAQLIRHITEPEYHHGWILRYGDNILYIYAILVVLNTIWQHIYYFVISLGLRLGLAPTDLKLATGLMVALALCAPALRDRYGINRVLKEAKKRAIAKGRSLG
jgi:hypothetical protein